MQSLESSQGSQLSSHLDTISEHASQEGSTGPLRDGRMSDNTLSQPSNNSGNSGSSGSPKSSKSSRSVQLADDDLPITVDRMRGWLSKPKQQSGL